jgi:hypothetical protein
MCELLAVCMPRILSVAILNGLEAQVTARRTSAGQNARQPPRHGQETEARALPGSARRLAD